MRLLADVAAFAVIAIIAAIVSWFVYWITLGAIFQSGVHPDYWPDELVNAAWVLAAITGLAAALLFFRTALGRGRR